jgi:hypothetical protein
VDGGIVLRRVQARSSILLVPILLSACSGAEGPSPTPPSPKGTTSRASAASPTPTTAAPTARTSAPGSSPSGPPSSPADLRAAQRAILTAKDLDQPFKETTYQPVPTADDDDAKLSRCIGRPPSRVHQTAKVFSPQFSRGDAEMILASITFVDTEATAADDVSALQGPTASRCIRQSFLEQFQRNNRVGSAEVSGLSPDLTENAPSANYRLRVVAQTSTGDLPVFVDLLQATKGRAEVSAEFLDVNQPVSASVEQRAMSAMLDRL